VILLHGDAGFVDEIVIAVVAFGILWLSLKLNKKKPIEDDDGTVPADEAATQVDKPS
jgi:hypothetical protein